MLSAAQFAESRPVVLWFVYYDILVELVFLLLSLLSFLVIFVPNPKMLCGIHDYTHSVLECITCKPDVI